MSPSIKSNSISNKQAKIICIILCLALCISGCYGQKQPNTPSESVEKVEKYDFHNERYQDFYSKFMRQVEKKELNARIYKEGFAQSFDYDYIKKYLGTTPPKKDFLFKMHVERLDPNDKKVGIVGKYRTKQNVLAHKKSLGENYNECEAYEQIEGLFCIRDHQLEYYYLPYEKGAKKIKYINQSINFYCNLNCTVLEFPTYPYNIEVIIHLTEPQEFFHIMSYVEQYLFNITGVHIWQRSLKQK